jgi:hypothetical protein
MATGRIHLDNLAREAVLSGGDWSGTLDRVLDPRITSLPARCADPSDLEASQFTIAWSQPVYLTDLMLCGHYAGLDSRYQVTAFEGEMQVAQLAWRDVFGAIFSSSDLPFEQSNWFTGKPRLKDIQGYARHLPIRFPSSVVADSLLVELDVRDVATAGDDFDLGYLLVTARLTPRWTFNWGRELAIARRTLEEITAGGRRIKARRTNARRHTVTFQHLSKAEAMAVYDLAMRDDEHPVVFDPNADDAVHEFREVFPATLTVTSPPSRTNQLGEWTITLTFEELQG